MKSIVMRLSIECGFESYLAGFRAYPVFSFYQNLYDRGELPCDRIEEKLQDKIAQIDKQIQELKTFKQERATSLTDKMATSAFPARQNLPDRSKINRQ